MAGPGSGGPFYFAWVDEGTPFSSAQYVYDEYIFDFNLTESEGQIPTLDLLIKNPLVGLMSPGRKQWAYFAWYNPVTSSVVNLFYGQLVGIPTDIEETLIRIQFIARAPDWISRRQAVAETLKIPGSYDPVMLDEQHRNDPDAILEAWASNYQVNRTTLAWSVSNIIVGEDGTQVFSGSQVIWGSVKVSPKQTPQIEVRIDATFTWNQRTIGGNILLGPYFVNTYTGDGLIDSWPKAGASIGGGWIVNSADAIDQSGIMDAYQANTSYEWHSAEQHHNEGDTISATTSSSYPVFWGGALYREIRLSWSGQSGGILDGQGQPTAWERSTYMIIPQFRVAAYMYLGYKADRKRTETATIIVSANLQSIITAPTIEQSTSLVKISSVNLSDFLITYDSWTTLAGQAVEEGQICLPNLQTSAGGTSFQICMTPGVCGTVAPTFSDIPGNTTADGSTVVWACFGSSLPSVPNDWRPSQGAALGTVIAPTMPSWVYYAALLPPVYPFRTVGAQVTEGQIIRADDNSSYQMCTISGVTVFGSTTMYGGGVPAFSPIYGSQVWDGSVQWTSLGTVLPSGILQLCVQAGTTAIQVPPPFSANRGDIVTDGSVKWMSLGPNPKSFQIPVGGTSGNTIAASYLPSDRGQQSIQYLINKARAILLQKARAIDITWQSEFINGINLSCRQNATVEAWNIPGGAATGKIKSYTLTGNGSSGEFLTTITIGVAVGFNGSVTAAVGTPTYISADYIEADYEEYTGGTSVIATSDIGYTRPQDNPNDDGLVFPLTAEQVVLGETWYGSVAAQDAAITKGTPAVNRVATIQQEASLATNNVVYQLLYARQMATVSFYSIADILTANPIYLDLRLKPVTGTAFTTNYMIGTTPLEVYQGINLEAS
jgi:hypothetical protein